MKKQNKLTGVKEIARRANVSLATVDRVIHNRGGVSKKTKEKIQLIIKELNYKPNILAQRLASPKKIRLAILLPKASKETTYWESLYQGILEAETEIQQYGFEIEKYFFDQKDKDSFNNQADIILQLQPDGILLTPIFIEESIRFINILEKKHIPFVFINSDIPDYNSLSYVGPDLYHSGSAVAHLISYMLTENSKILIVKIAKELEMNNPLLRIEEGFRRYISDNRKEFNILDVEIKQTDFASVEASISKVLDTQEQIDAIFVTSSRVFTIANYLEKKEIIKKPIVIGFDFLEESVKHLEKGNIDFLICHNPKEQAYKGINILFQHLVSEVKVEKSHLMPIDIITKENAPFYKG